MKQQKSITTGLATVIGAGFSLGLGATTVEASANPFQLHDLGGGYQLVAEASCGGNDGKGDSEGQCGANDSKGDDKTEEGKCASNDQGDDGKTDEASCGANNA